MKAHREFTENGVRMVQLEEGGEPFIVQQDFAQWVALLENEQIENEQKRAAHRLFQLAFPSLDPATAYREAVRLIEACGGSVPSEFHRMRPRGVPDAEET